MKIEVNLVPFNVPDLVGQEVPARPRQEGFKEAPSYALKELSEETLSGMCDEFRKGVFEKAGKKDPALGDKE